MQIIWLQVPAAKTAFSLMIVSVSAKNENINIEMKQKMSYLWLKPVLLFFFTILLNLSTQLLCFTSAYHYSIIFCVPVQVYVYNNSNDIYYSNTTISISLLLKLPYDLYRKRL